MVDKIKIVLPYKANSYQGLPKSKIMLPDEERGLTSYHFKVWNSYRDHYLDLTVVPNSEMILDGSIRKWYYGKITIKDLSFEDLLDCLRRIANIMKFDFTSFLDCKIRSVEIGKNIRVNYPSISLLLCFLRHPRIKMVDSRNTSKTFRGRNFSIIIYDKLEEMKAHRIKAAKIYQRRFNIIRYELKIRSMSAVQYKIRMRATLKNFLQSYDRMLLLWLNEYKKIVQITDKDFLNNMANDYKSVQEFKKNFMIYGTKEFGLENSIKKINEMNISSKSKSKLRKEILSPLLPQKNDMIFQFSDRIDEIYREERKAFKHTIKKNMQVQEFLNAKL
jgi:hypothetical protein